MVIGRKGEHRYTNVWFIAYQLKGVGGVDKYYSHEGEFIKQWKEEILRKKKKSGVVGSYWVWEQGIYDNEKTTRTTNNTTLWYPSSHHCEIVRGGCMQKVSGLRPTESNDLFCMQKIKK